MTQVIDCHMSQQARELVCELCRAFYAKGWASGTGGGLSLRVDEQIFMAPSGVQKERLLPEDIFILDASGEVISAPASGLKCSECKPLFMAAYELRGAGAVLHSHSLSAMLVTWLYQDLFEISQLEMQKGLVGGAVFETLQVPIIANTAFESELTDSLRAAIVAHPNTHAVLVRGHGVYVWGKTWQQAKTQAECYDYLFEAALRCHQLGLDPRNLKPPRDLKNHGTNGLKNVFKE